MSLSIAGYVQLATLGLSGAPSCVVQDWNDLDTFYFIVQGATWKVYKFKWPDTLVEIADIGAWSGKGATKAALDYNYDYVLGVIDATLHYGLAISADSSGSAGTGILTIVDVNLSTGAYTSYSPSLPSPPYFQPWAFSQECHSFSDGEGTHFFTTFGGGGNDGNFARKYYNVGSGYVHTQIVGMGRPYLWIDDQNFAAYCWYKATCSGVGGAISVGSGYLPKSDSKFSTIIGLASVPRNPIGIDNWQYLFMSGYPSGGGNNKLLFFRKNVVTGVYSMVDLGEHANADFITAATMDYGEIGSALRLYYVNSLYRYRVYGSDLWPPDANTYVDVDNISTYVTAVWTNPVDGIIYAFHYNGVLGATVTKIADTELVSEPVASPSVSSTGAKVVWKDKRVFFIKVPGYGRHLWWGAPFEPQSLDPSWDGYNTPVFENEDNTALQVYGDMVYIGSRAGWKRLRGKTPDYWQLDDIDSVVGPVTDKTVAVTPFGAIYPREDGLYLFNGYSTRLFYPQAKGIMESVNWDAVDKAFSLWDGRYFHFFYPSGSATVNDRELIVDLIGGMENARATESTRVASAGFYDPITKILFLGDENGNLLVPGSSGSRSLEVITKEFAANKIIQAGTFQKLHYEADTLGEDLIVTPYYDGVEQSQRTINTTVRRRGFVTLPKGNAYRVGIKISITTDKDVRIYEPWVLE